MNELDFSSLMATKGHVFRQIKNRLTKRIQINGQSVVIKLHDKMGLTEYLKTYLKFKHPVVGAKPEKLAIEQLQKVGIIVPKILGFQQLGSSFYQQSYIILEDLGNAPSLEDWVNHEKLHLNDSQKKHQLIKQVASIARKLHQANLVHRDFYLCHFIERNNTLTLIDLHRCQNATESLIIKDLGGLLFSAENTLSQRDKLRFIKAYRKQGLAQIFANERVFWGKVIARSELMFNRNKRG